MKFNTGDIVHHKEDSSNTFIFLFEVDGVAHTASEDDWYSDNMLFVTTEYSTEDLVRVGIRNINGTTDG